MLKIKLVFICSLAPIIMSAKVWVYKNPGKSVVASPFYNVSINQEEEKYQSFVYHSKATYGNLERSLSWTTFSFSDKITLDIEVFSSSVEDCVIRPKSKNIIAKIKGNHIFIELDKPEKMVVEINENKYQTLFIFADPPEENIPEENDKGVWNFGAGIHTVGRVLVPDTVRHIYIAGGAYVKGAFSNKNKGSNFKITGRGVVSAEGLNMQTGPIVSLTGKGLNVYIEGITLLNGKAHGVEINQDYSTFRNCKIIGWQPKTDGVVFGEHALIENCFFRCNGDAVKLYGNYTVVKDCLFWQNEEGAVFQFGWNLKKDHHNFRILDCDIVYCEHSNDADNAAIFSSVHGGNGRLSNYLFKNIRIEDDVFRLFKLTIRTNAYDDDSGYGSISNIQFKNIKLEGECLNANEIWGYNQQHTIGDVAFENLIINNKSITNEDIGNFKINLNTTSGVVFK